MTCTSPACPYHGQPRAASCGCAGRPVLMTEDELALMDARAYTNGRMKARDRAERAISASDGGRLAEIYAEKWGQRAEERRQRAHLLVGALRFFRGRPDVETVLLRALDEEFDRQSARAALVENLHQRRLCRAQHRFWLRQLADQPSYERAVERHFAPLDRMAEPANESGISYAGDRRAHGC